MHIEVADIEKSLELYSQLLTYSKVIWWEDKQAVALVLEDGSAFGIWKGGKTGIHGGRAGAHLHFAFQIEPEQYDECKSRIEAAGLRSLEHEWRGGQRSLYFFDYDGNQGEFMTTNWFADL